MSPDEVATALAWDGIFWARHKLQAFRKEDGCTRPIQHIWWKNFCKKNLHALTDDLKAKEITFATGYRDWQRASLVGLPAGSFVWKDEYERIYGRAFGTDGATFITDSGEVMSDDAHAKHVALDYDPYVPDAETKLAVMEGFEPLANADLSALPTPDASLVKTETADQRQDRRLKMCVDAGLTIG